VQHPILFLFVFGLISSKISNKLVVAHMSKSEMSNMDVTLFVPLVFYLNAYLSLGIPEHYILWAAMVSGAFILSAFRREP
jgi:choline/ethanolamine phosphotransferase